MPLKNSIRCLVLAVASLAPKLGVAAGEPEPLWAYGYLTPPAPGDKAVPQGTPVKTLRPNDDRAVQTRPHHVAGSSAAFSLLDIRAAGNVADWFPEDHPPMPKVIVSGPVRMGAAARGCAACHLPTGKGRPENAPVVGQPPAYFIRQIEDFRSGARHTFDPRKPNTGTMIALAKALTDEEVKAAADYFGAMKWTPWTRVIETERVPKTKIEGNLFIATSSALTEPIAGRIIEVPENEEQSERLRNPRSGFIAYVPPGSLKRGENLVTTGGVAIVDGKIVPGKTIACATCHGPALQGLADFPGIAGRSPSYLVRQLYDIQQGARNGPTAVLMKPVVANLTNDDFVAIAAYVATLSAPPAPTQSAAKF